ncbi:Tumour suppressor candidate 2 [Cinara cedri]|uniref:Tumour suppressor candidate 2 n=1 Tax=Cinara cedri TaxID=506608 RepID=A0A5E4N3B9_9HEMI|nr:Tumour suppressor candidate 2 [Cinara cedri]
MGGKTTKLFRNTSHSSKTQDESDTEFHEQLHTYTDLPEETKEEETIVKKPVSPFVHYRKGSMFIDEDGDVAHEFYVETKVGSKVTLKKISNRHLTPQGNVRLDVPCLRNDYPLILWDQNKTKE